MGIRANLLACQGRIAESRRAGDEAWEIADRLNLGTVANYVSSSFFFWTGDPRTVFQLAERELDRNRLPHENLSRAMVVEQVVQAALKASRLRDLTVEDPPMEEIVKAIYAGS